MILNQFLVKNDVVEIVCGKGGYSRKYLKIGWQCVHMWLTVYTCNLDKT